MGITYRATKAIKAITLTDLNEVTGLNTTTSASQWPDQAGR